MAVTEHPQGIIGRELGVGFKMQPVPEAAPVVKKTTGVPDPCPEPLFFLWKVVISNIFDGSVVAVVEVGPDGNSGAPVPYPDGCFRFEVFRGGCLPSGVCLDLLLEGFPDPDFNMYTDSDHLSTLDGCNGALLIYNPAFPSAAGSLVGSQFTLAASVNGDPYGPTIWFACDPSAYETTFHSWTQRRDYPGGSGAYTTTPNFYALPPSGARYFMQLDGLLWDTPDSISWVVTQTAGPPVPDMSYFEMVAPAPFAQQLTPDTARCATWDIQLVDGYDYTGTEFGVQAMYGGNPLGPQMGWSATTTPPPG